MVESLSIREFARRAGCDNKVVRRKIQSGHLPTLSDGKLDASLVEKDWRTGPLASALRVDTVDSADTLPPLTNASLIRQVLAEEGQVLDEGGLTLTHVRMAVGILKAREQAIQNDVVSGALIAIEDVGKIVEDEYATIRANFLSMPGEIAGDCEGLDAAAIEEVIASKVTEILVALSADETYQEEDAA